MTEEKELIKRIKNSRKKGLSHSQIRNCLQNRGYKLEYIDLLIRKSAKTRRFLIISLVIFIIVLSLAIAVYSLFFSHSKFDLQNPLEGITILFDSEKQNQSNQTIHIDDIEITPEFLSYLLNEVGAWKLHKNPTTFENPVINFRIDEQNFYSEITNKIQTSEGSSEQADIEFVIPKKDLVQAIISETPAQVFKQSIQDGNTQINTLAGEAELFAKGYLSLYDELKV